MSRAADSGQAAELLEASAAAIAQRGRELLLERLRVAYREAAAAHADVLQVDDERIETMVQRAIQRADGLQWRRALASAGAQELRITIAQALTHPAVERAQALADAPSYEQDIEALGRGGHTRTDQGAAAPVPPPTATQPRPAPAPAPSPPPHRRPRPRHPYPDPYRNCWNRRPRRRPSSKPPASSPMHHSTAPRRDSDDLIRNPGPRSPRRSLDRARKRDGAGPEPAATEVHDLVPVFDAEPTDRRATVPGDRPDPIRVRATHLGGVADLLADQKIDLRISGDGLDLIDADDTIMGRLGWSEIEDLFVPDPVGRRERRRPTARLVVQTRQGDASFEVATLSREVLRERLRPLVAHFQQD